MRFQPFAVQCLTCGSRLRVTNPAVVGGIVACPKCQSMVAIEPPKDSSPAARLEAGSSSIDSQAITEDAVADHADPALTATPVSPQRGFAGESAVPPEPAPGEMGDPAAFESHQTRRVRHVALVATISLSALLLASLTFVSFVRAYRSEPAVVQPLADTRSPSEEPTAPPASTQQPAGTPQPEDPPPAETIRTNESPPTVSGDNTAGDTGIAAGDIASGEARIAPLDPAVTPMSATDSKIPAEPAATSVTQPPAVADPDASRMQELPPGLAKFTPFLLQAEPTEPATLQPPPTLDEVQLEAAAEDTPDALVPHEPRVLNLQADLALQLAIRSDGYPLVDMLLLISELTGVPIQIDGVSFDLAEIDLDTKITPPSGRMSAREMLDAVAAQAGAEIREQETLLVFTVTDERFANAIEPVLALDDFGEGKSSAASVLERFLAEAPKPPQEAAAQGEDAAMETADAQTNRHREQLAALATESLRRLRGLEPRVSDDRIARWIHTQTGAVNQWPELQGGQPIKWIDTPVALAGVLRRTARQNDAVCLVNWFDANRRRATPERLVLPSPNSDAAGLLQETLAPYRLQVRQVDPNHWWVGSEATYDRLPVVVATMPLKAGREAFVGQLTALMAGADRDSFRIAIDPQTDRALLMLPRFLARQLPKLTAPFVSETP